LSWSTGGAGSHAGDCITQRWTLLAGAGVIVEKIVVLVTSNALGGSWFRMGRERAGGTSGTEST